MRARTTGKGNAAVAGFALALLAGTWVLGGPCRSILPTPASQFLAVLNTEQVAGERVSLWERLAAGIVLAAQSAPRQTSPRS